MISSLLDFISKSPSPFHASRSMAAALKELGFIELDERSDWPHAPGSYFTTRNSSSLIAFHLSGENDADRFHIIGAHTDSPVLKLKSNAQFEKEGYLQAQIEVYGGALLSTWMDRDLSLAGRIAYEDNGVVREKLVDLKKPIFRVPNLAIHLNPEVNRKGLILNFQREMAPVFGLSEEGASLETYLAEKAGIRAGTMMNFDLCLYDTTLPALSGWKQEFVNAGRLDNLAMCEAARLALESAVAVPGELAGIPVLACFDHEEVGSVSAAGAASNFLRSTLERIMHMNGAGNRDLLPALARSLFISADMAHAVHPNYPAKHADNHKPVLNRGPVIKINQNQRYTTNALTESYFELLCRGAGVPVQKFVNRSDLGCGSTIGPVVSSDLGISSLDVGNPMLSMHSIREMSGALDHDLMVRAMSAFYRTPLN